VWRPSSTRLRTGHVGMLRITENFDNLPSNLSSKDGRLGVLIFATVFQIGKRLSAQPPDCCRVCLSLSLSPPTVSSTPSSPLNYKPMLAHTRTTTEQRSRMDALELGDDSGSLSASRNRRHSPQARGGFADGLDASHWINMDWKQLWTRRRTRTEGGQSRRLRRASLTRLPIFLTGNRSMPWTPT
jgi:hypothetical protein